jgi:hypothetical protein
MSRGESDAGPGHADHVWGCDHVAEHAHDGRPLNPLTPKREYTSECLAIRVQGRRSGDDVLRALAELFLEHGDPEHLR